MRHVFFRIFKLSRTTIQKILDTLSTNVQLTITGNPYNDIPWTGSAAWIISDVVPLTFTATNNLTIDPTTLIGKYIYGHQADPKASAGTYTNVSFNGTTNTIDKTGHNLVNGQIITTRYQTTVTAIPYSTTLYVVNATTNSFQISLTSGGSPINFGGVSGTGSIAYPIKIIAATTTTITFDYPIPATGMPTAISSVRYLNLFKAYMNNTTLTG